jgi:hypothetical protein
MSRSIPAGGQITPFDWASLSLSGSELPPPTVGGSPLTSGGHVVPCSDVFSVGCASTIPACAKPTNAAMMKVVRRKSNSSQIHRACLATSPGAKRSRWLGGGGIAAHVATDRFKKYQATTGNMIAKRNVRTFSSVAMLSP